MQKRVLIAVAAAAMATLSCTGGGGAGGGSTGSPAANAAPSANERHTRIHFTKNHRKGTPYNTDCIGIVTTETMGTQRGHKVFWHIDLTNGHNNSDDKCDTLNTSDVNLRFQSDVFGASAMRKLDATGMVIMGTVSSNMTEAPDDSSHKYRVYIGNEPAGPDPEIDVGCIGCGPGPAGPGE